MLAKIHRIKDELRIRMNRSIDINGRWLRTMLKGHYAYYGVPRNNRAMSRFYHEIGLVWFKRLRRRGQRHRITWKRMKTYSTRYLPYPLVIHPWPSERFDVRRGVIAST